MNRRHREQVEGMIGKKVTAYFGFDRKVERVLHEDKAGLFIRCKGQRVSCRPDTTTLNVIRFIALDPKIERRKKNGKNKWITS